MEYVANNKDKIKTLEIQVNIKMECLHGLQMVIFLPK